jgi:ubiquitin carboxyl-terminal hydrolase L3
MTKQWLPLESNPELFTQYAISLGLKPNSIVFHDLLAMEPWALDMIPKPVHAAIFLFPLGSDSHAAPESSDSCWFTEQTIGNACGTVAVLHALCNLSADFLEENSYISNFVKNTRSLSPSERAALIENDDDLENAHKEMEHLGQSAEESPETDCGLHFVCFVAVGDKIYELDGRRKNPSLMGVLAEDEEFLQKVVEIVKKLYIDPKPEEMRFALLPLAPPQIVDQ